MSERRTGVNWLVGLAYGLPNYGLALMIGPAMGILHGFLAKNYKLSLWNMGMVFIIARIFDAVTDPVVGIVSDKLRRRFWGRRSWLVAGVSLSLLAMYFILVRSEQLTPVIFCIWMLVSFLAWTVAEVPYLAWGTEIAEDYNDRTKLFSYKALLGYVGSLIYLVLPILIMYYQTRVQGVPKEDTTLDYSPLSMRVTFWMLAIIMPLAVFVALKVCPDGSHIKQPEKKNLLRTLGILVRNKAMLIFSGAFILLGVAGGLQIGMAYLHLSVYLNVQNTSTIYLFAFLCSLLGVPFWNWFASRKGKHVAFTVGLFITVPFFVWLSLMEPSNTETLIYGQPKVFWEYLITICTLNFCQVVYFVMPPAIMGDIANADMIKTKTDETGTYYSIYTFTYKTVLGVGQGVALLLAGRVFEFDPEATVQTEKAAMGVKMFMGYVPAAFAFAGALLMTRYPITRKKYEEIQQTLKEMGLKTSE
jgi:glycoside/pentoside/hexuronide:cation symporter, GPH family